MIAVDSFKLRIPIDEVTILHPEYFDKNNYKVVNIGSGELVDEKHWKASVPSITVHQYVTVRIATEHQINRVQKVQQYLILMLNSKLLMGDYLEGIHAGNIRQLYDSLMAAPEVQQLVDIPYKAFLNGVVTDCDFKKDVLRNTHDFKAAIHRLQSLVGRDNPLVKAYTRRDNMGIQFSSRDTTNFKKHPFLKLYSKPLEMNSKHADFKREVLGDKLHPDTVRTEFTIKNAKHWRKYDVQEARLDYIVNLPQDKLEQMMQDAIQAYIGTTHKAPKKRAATLKPDHIMVLDYIEDAVHRGISYSEWKYQRKASMKANDVHRNVISDKMKLYDALYRQYIKGSPEDAKATSAQQFLFEVFGSVFEVEEAN